MCVYVRVWELQAVGVGGLTPSQVEAAEESLRFVFRVALRQGAGAEDLRSALEKETDLSDRARTAMTRLWCAREVRRLCMFAPWRRFGCCHLFFLPPFSSRVRRKHPPVPPWLDRCCEPGGSLGWMLRSDWRWGPARGGNFIYRWWSFPGLSRIHTGTFAL